MRPHYDFAKLKRRKNPFPKLLKQRLTIRIDNETVQYFKGLAGESGLPYQSLINLYLRDCVAHRRQLSFKWEAGGRKPSA